MKTLIQVDINTELPKNPGKYIVDTKTRHSSNSFLASFNGKSFDVTNQIVTHWYKEDKMDNNDIIQVAEKLYREKNPESKMDVPSFAYELVEKWAKEWFFANSELSLYDWIKENKTLK